MACRETGWHGESGQATWGGHITVDFEDSDDNHVTTQHVYPTNAGYGYRRKTWYRA